MNRILFVLFSLTFLILSCTSKNYGPEGERIIDLENISSLHIEGNFTVLIQQSTDEQLILNAPEELIDKIEVTQNNGQLKIMLDEQTKNFLEENTIQLEISLADLSFLEYSIAGKLTILPYFQVDDIRIQGQGAGKVELNLEAESIIAEFSMVGEATLNGSSENFTLRNDGLGKIDASELFAKNTVLSSSGIGSIQVYAEETLSLNVSGIGKVVYSGPAEVIKRNVSGIGKVEYQESTARH